MKATTHDLLGIYDTPTDDLTFDGQDVNTEDAPDALTRDALRAELGLEWGALDAAADDDVNQFLSDMDNPSRHATRKG